MENQKPTPPEQGTCGGGNGQLPGTCASLAFPYIPRQDRNPERYENKQALANGTLFPGLHLPFFRSVNGNLSGGNTAQAEMMALDFAIHELGLYLTTHPQDKEVLELYRSYVSLAREGREKYEKLYGPLLSTSSTEGETFAWVKDPWPWDEGGNV